MTTDEPKIAKRNWFWGGVASAIGCVIVLETIGQLINELIKLVG